MEVRVVPTVFEEFDEFNIGDEARAVHVQHHQVFVWEVGQAECKAQRGGKLREVDWREFMVLRVMSKGGSVE